MAMAAAAATKEKRMATNSNKEDNESNGKNDEEDNGDVTAKWRNWLLKSGNCGHCHTHFFTISAKDLVLEREAWQLSHNARTS